MLPLQVSSERRPQLTAGQPTILLAEDEDQLRTMLTIVLRDRGYKIHAARDGREAVQLADALGGPIDLLLSDVDMPGMSGPAVADSLQARRPQMKVILMSGLQAAAFVIREDWEFLQKPFAVDALIAKVACLCGSDRNH